MKLRIQQRQKHVDRIAKGKDTIAEVVLASFEQNQPVLIRIYFDGSLVSGKIQVKAQRLDCESSCENDFIVGEDSAIQAYLIRSKIPPQVSIEELAGCLVQLEINSGNSLVGPPVEVIRLDKKGTHQYPFEAKHQIAGCFHQSVK